ncbi:hypothetical protein [Vibrio crassostreae]|uniref:hypothetical protein n=1 Tax=Vibrio crassostreae TaxID=246167 RepID=UPI001B313F09|nr:hypothetical protein [Vibrio crassostreae]
MKSLNKKLPKIPIDNFVDPLINNGIDGFKGFDSAHSVALKYMELFNEDSSKAINRVIKEHCYKTGISNASTTFATAFLAPVAITANLASTMLLQVRMISVIAILHGKDPKDRTIQNEIMSCLTLDKATQDSGSVIKKKVSSDLLVATSEALAQQVLLKTTKKSMVHQSKYLPLFGTIIGTAYDFYTTNSVGYFAHKRFSTPS